MTNLPLPASEADGRHNLPPSGGSMETFRLPVWKRAIDLICCVAALPGFALCTLFAAVLTFLTSRGPIFFRQERIGQGGRPFFIYKFRTMHVSATVATHRNHFAQLIKSGAPMQKLEARGDARVIPGGWLLRATGFDELPQIINVLRGEMSLVGPRPCIPYEFEHFTPEQRRRCDAAPGLTGLWQVSGKNRTTFDEMIRLDIEYAQRCSPALDFRIIASTIPTLLGQVSDMVKARRSARALAQVEVPPVAAPVITESRPDFPVRSFSNPPFRRSPRVAPASVE
jgi:lipopolysaccharide/colanic/teichoic acid biosynthesis glycosyltransferase